MIDRRRAKKNNNNTIFTINLFITFNRKLSSTLSDGPVWCLTRARVADRYASHRTMTLVMRSLRSIPPVTHRGSDSLAVEIMWSSLMVRAVLHTNQLPQSQRSHVTVAEVCERHSPLGPILWLGVCGRCAAGFFFAWERRHTKSVHQKFVRRWPLNRKTCWEEGTKPVLPGARSPGMKAAGKDEPKVTWLAWRLSLTRHGFGSCRVHIPVEASEGFGGPKVR